MTYGILLVSHSQKLAQGLYDLIQEVASDVPILVAGGSGDGGIGTDFAKIQSALDQSSADQFLAFYDLGSAKMNLDMVQDFSPDRLKIYDVALVEGAYTAAALLQAGADLATIEEELAPLALDK